MGSGLDDWIYWHFFTNTINYDSSQSMTRTRSIPCWTTSVFFSTLTNDERRIAAHTLNCLERYLSDESLSFITSRRLEYRSPSQTVPLLFSRCHGNVFVNIRCHGNLCLATSYLTTGCPTVDCVTSRICLLRRCLENGHIPSKYFAANIETTEL
jgi:hypothetical protein